MKNDIYKNIISAFESNDSSALSMLVSHLINRYWNEAATNGTYLTQLYRQLKANHPSEAKKFKAIIQKYTVWSLDEGKNRTKNKSEKQTFLNKWNTLKQVEKNRIWPLSNSGEVKSFVPIKPTPAAVKVDDLTPEKCFETLELWLRLLNKTIASNKRGKRKDPMLVQHYFDSLSNTFKSICAFYGDETTLKKFGLAYKALFDERNNEVIKLQDENEQLKSKLSALQKMLNAKSKEINRLKQGRHNQKTNSASSESLSDLKPSDLDNGFGNIGNRRFTQFK